MDWEMTLLLWTNGESRRAWMLHWRLRSQIGTVGWDMTSLPFSAIRLTQMFI
jgi:hypothetical protein